MRRANHVGLLCLGLLAALALAGCSLFPGSWELWGTWTNSEYDGLGGMPAAKMVFKEGGEVEGYDNVSDTEPIGTYQLDLVDDWTESGEHWFKADIDIDGMAYYVLFLISDGGDTLEGISDPEDYPTTIDPASDFYARYNRQE